MSIDPHEPDDLDCLSIVMFLGSLGFLLYFLTRAGSALVFAHEIRYTSDIAIWTIAFFVLSGYVSRSNP